MEETEHSLNWITLIKKDGIAWSRYTLYSGRIALNRINFLEIIVCRENKYERKKYETQRQQG